jgi:hypothetical protein
MYRFPIFDIFPSRTPFGATLADRSGLVPDTTVQWTVVREARPGGPDLAQMRPDRIRHLRQLANQKVPRPGARASL